jgi:hypothetical protein
MIGLIEPNPEEYVRPLDNFADIVNRKGFKTHPVLVCNAIYDGGLPNITRRNIVASGDRMQFRTSCRYHAIIAA